MPQGLSFSVSLPVALAVSIALGSQRIFCPLSPAVCALGCLMSRGDEVRQLAAQLSVLAALEDSIALGLSRVMGPASPGRAATSPDAGSPSAPAVNAAAAAPWWCLRPVTRWQPLCCALRLSGLHPLGPALAPVLLRRCPNVHRVHRVAVPALPLACVDRLFSRSRDWLRAWPPRVAHRSRLPSCAFPASLALHAASVGSQPSVDASGPFAPSAPVSEAPRVTESASNSDDEWDALLDAHGLAPSLGGAAAAVAQPAEAAGASRRARDKRRRRQRKAAKRSMWRDI